MRRTSFLLTLAVLIVCSCLQATADNLFSSSRTDFRDESIYFVMTTRFYDGDTGNNVLCWDNQTSQISTKDPCWRGDFQGLIDKLDYIKALGFTAIWITPVVQNASGYDYHGYHASDFSKVDVRYQGSDGTSGDVEFKRLIDAAHAKGIKIILDIVLNHTGNFGEEHFKKEFNRRQSLTAQGNTEYCMEPIASVLGADYPNLQPADQYQRRLAQMKNVDGQNHDTHNYWHHYGSFNWDEPNRWWAQIAGDCVDLNTENPAVSAYLIKCYEQFIKLGVDGFRIDTSGHIARLTFNKAFIPQFTALGEQYKDKRKLAGQTEGEPFYMFGEVCARYSEVTYRGQPNLSPYFYTWKSSDDLLNSWNTDSTWWDSQVVPEGADPLGNMNLCLDEASDMPESNNAVMVNGAWHKPDYSKSSGFNVIDFPVHYNFSSAASAYGLATSGDKLYNDATWNVVYVDSHDYGPQPNDGTRFSGGTDQWAENLTWMFFFRGIPCLYYGSEVEFQAGKKIDNGPNGPLSETGRAYFGQNLEGTVSASDFGVYTATGQVAKTLNHPLAKHLSRLNRIRQAVPALRKGQYSVDGCTKGSGWAWKKAYNANGENSYACVGQQSGATTFTGIPNGTYRDCVTGDVQTVTNGTLSFTCPTNKGNARVYVLNGPGKIGDDTPFLYTSTAASADNSALASDPGTTWNEIAEPANPRVTLSPDGGKFSTPSQKVTLTLTDATTGWYKIDNGVQTTLTGTASVTIGEQAQYNQDITISWSATGTDGNGKTVTNTGKSTFTKVDPNAAINIYVEAPSAPNLYAWTTENGFTEELNGAWPGATMTATEVVDGVTYYKQSFTGVQTMNIIFNNGSSKTSDITGIGVGDNFFTYDGATGYTKGKGGNQGGGSKTDEYPYCFFVNSGNWTYVSVWAWEQGGDGAAYVGTAWPGVTLSDKVGMYNGYDIYKWTSTKTTEPNGGIIFSTDNGNTRAGNGDLVFVNKAYYNADGQITDQATLNELTTILGIGSINANGSSRRFVVYNLQGMQVAEVSTLSSLKHILRPGTYIVNGQKIMF